MSHYYTRVAEHSLIFYTQVQEIVIQLIATRIQQNVVKLFYKVKEELKVLIRSSSIILYVVLYYYIYISISLNSNIVEYYYIIL